MRKVKEMTEEEYRADKSAVLAAIIHPDDVDAIGKLMSYVHDTYWAGEYYDLDGARLYPRYNEAHEIIGYEFR